MKKRRIIMVTSSVLFILLLYLQFGRDVSVCGSIAYTSEAEYTQKLTIIANRLCIPDRERFAKKMIERAYGNSFRDRMFSYGVNGYPDELEITVYMNKAARKWKRKAFEVRYNKERREVEIIGRD